MSSHSFIRLISVRSYINVDYIFLCTIDGVITLHIVSSYDIACQWCINFRKRVKNMPARLQPPESVTSKITFVVPAFHLEAHIDKCKTAFSPRLTKNIARTDFECIERGWSFLNGAASAMKEMRPGHRRDVLDDFCGFYNWLKTITLRTFSSLFLFYVAGLLMIVLDTTMTRKMLEAIPAAILHRATLDGFEDNLKLKFPDHLEEWIEMYTKWQNSDDKTIGNPFVVERTGMFLFTCLTTSVC